MSRKKILKRSLLIAVMALAAGCGDAPQPLDLVEPQMAKGGNGKGGQGSDTGTYALLEYFVYQDAELGNVVHVVGEGDVPTVNLNVVHDNPFNGIRDSGIHYEYTTFAPLPVPVADPLSDNKFHVDIPWNGLRHDPSQARIDAGEVKRWFSDFLVSDVDASGADPFAFDVRFLSDQGSLLYTWPQGIIMEGTETGDAEAQNVKGLGHDEMSVRSYATYKGDVPPKSVYLTEVSFTNVQCKVVSVREGRGKNATTRDVARITGDYGINTWSTGGIQPSTWVEFHMVDVTDPTHPVFSDGRSADDGNPADGIYGSFVRDFDVVPQGPVSVVLAVDYVFPTRDEWNWAYNPALNTNDGFTTESTLIRALGDPSPTAFSATSEITCN